MIVLIMNEKYVVKVRRMSQTDGFIYLIVFLPFLFALMNEVLGLPWSIRYIIDVAWCLLLVYMFLSGRRGPQSLAVWIWLFLIYTLFAYLPQCQSPLYYLWGMRNNFRFYAAFFAFAVFMKPEDVDDWLKLFDKLFWVDVVVSVYQFLILGIDGDQLGGLFSTETGGNGYTNIFLLIILTKTVIFCLEKRENLGVCLAKCAAALVVAAMAELKFFFVEFALVIAMAVLFTSFSWRKLVIVLGAVIGVTCCVALLVAIFPIYTNWFSFEGMLETALSDRGYTSSGDLNRLNSIPRINELWLKTGWQRVFGLGLGNCDTASYAIVNTPFFEAYGDMHYTWISYAMMYLETGWIGLIFYWGFFVLVYFRILKIEKHSEGIAGTYCRIARIMAVMCVGISIYNSSLRTEAGYMAYFVLAVPFALNRNVGGRNIYRNAYKETMVQ